jgi:hypothetical protein
MNVMSRVDRAGLRLTEIGLDLREMIADGVIDQQEIEQLQRLAGDVLDVAVEVEDVSLDVECARQVLRLGRPRTPNRDLTKKLIDFEQSRAALEQNKSRSSADTGDAA